MWFFLYCNLHLFFFIYEFVEHLINLNKNIALKVKNEVMLQFMHLFTLLTLLISFIFHQRDCFYSWASFSSSVNVTFVTVVMSMLFKFITGLSALNIISKKWIKKIAHLRIELHFTSGIITFLGSLNSHFIFLFILVRFRIDLPTNSVQFDFDVYLCKFFNSFNFNWI